MARFYYDKQDFTSDLNIEVAREADILEYGEDLPSFKGCKKNPGHSGFIPFKDLKLEDLPHKIRSTETLNTINTWGFLVVRLVVDKQKDGILVREAGTGYVVKEDNMLCIKTNNHVVKDDDEVRHCIVQFNYDESREPSAQMTCKGLKLLNTCPYRDVSIFLMEHSCMNDILSKLDNMIALPSSPFIVIYYKHNDTVRCSSNPRFKSPRLVYYTSQNLNDPEIIIMFISWTDNSIRYLKSSYFKFHPIPSNIQQLTSIEIHIDEDGGNSRVIPGDVIKVNEDYVVKISESIFQDEVKKCRLVWNGEVIGRGTRLYFEQVESKEFLNGLSEIDLERILKKTSPYIWLFDYHPQPRGIEQYNRMISNPNSLGPIVCCIGHPHAGRKIVTFGRLLGREDKYFDGKKVECIQYTCKTCKGSSGSPVFIPNNNFHARLSGVTHFTGESVTKFLPNGEPVENVNIAWG